MYLPIEVTYSRSRSDLPYGGPSIFYVLPVTRCLCVRRKAYIGRRHDWAGTGIETVCHVKCLWRYEKKRALTALLYGQVGDRVCTTYLHHPLSITMDYIPVVYPSYEIREHATGKPGLRHQRYPHTFTHDLEL